MKKAVFFDIDGTLVDQKMEIPASTVDAIRKLKENGHYAFLCSGRSRSNIFSINLLDLEFDGILGGCGTYLEYQGEVIYEKKLERPLIEKTISVLKQNEFPFILEGSSRLYAYYADFEENPYVDYLKKNLGDRFIDLQGFEGEMEVNKLSAEYEHQNLDRVLRDLDQDYESIVHDFKILELVPSGHTKATGIKLACEYLGIEHENTYAFGDSANDMDMLQYVRHGIAMGNASQTVKEISDFVTASIHEDGIYAGLKHFELID